MSGFYCWSRFIANEWIHFFSEIVSFIFEQQGVHLLLWYWSCCRSDNNFTCPSQNIWRECIPKMFCWTKPASKKLSKRVFCVVMPAPIITMILDIFRYIRSMSEDFLIGSWIIKNMKVGCCEGPDRRAIFPAVILESNWGWSQFHDAPNLTLHNSTSKFSGVLS